MGRVLDAFARFFQSTSSVELAEAANRTKIPEKTVNL